MNESYISNITLPGLNTTQNISTIHNNTEQNIRDEENSLQELIMTSFLLAISSVAGTTMNAVVICAIVCSEKLRKPADCLIVATAVNAFLLCAFVYPLQFYETIYGQQDHLNSLCHIDAIFLPFSVYQTITMFPIIAYNRYAYVVKSRPTYDKLFSMPKVTLYIIMSWVLPFVCVGIPIVTYKAEIEYSDIYRICTISLNAILEYIELIYFIIFYLLTIIPYFKLFIYVRTHVSDRSRRQTGSNAISRKMDTLAIRMIGVVSFGYAICYAPYLVIRAVDPHQNDLPAVVHKITLSILSLGGFINPLLFVFTNNCHQLAIKGLFRCKSPDTFISSTAF